MLSHLQWRAVCNHLYGNFSARGICNSAGQKSFSRFSMEVLLHSKAVSLDLASC